MYFGWDEDNLTSQARGVLQQAVAEARECGLSSVVLEGHTDSSGAASYNVGLSQRRAAAVQAALVQLGVPGSAISTEAFGESALAVETPDGVREPLNRRTEIMIDFN